MLIGTDDRGEEGEFINWDAAECGGGGVGAVIDRTKHFYLFKNRKSVNV